MRGLKSNENIIVNRAVCGFDKNQFSKPVLLAYNRGYLTYRDLVAVHQIEDSIIAIENNGLKSSTTNKDSASNQQNKKLPTNYAHTMIDKFNQWIDSLSQNKIVAGAILDLLIDGKSFVYVDRRFRRTNGWARTNMVSGLNLWNERHI